MTVKRIQSKIQKQIERRLFVWLCFDVLSVDFVVKW